MRYLLLFTLLLLFAAASGTPVVWERTYDFGGTGTEFLCVQETSDCNFVVAGKIAYFSDARILLFDGDGIHLWSSEYGISGRTFWVEEVPTGGYVATGISYPSGGGEHNVLILRVDASGDTLWSRSYGWYDREDEGNCIRNYPGGGFVVCGTSSFDDYVDPRMWILRTDENGDTLWTRTILESCDETFGQSLVIDFEGNIVAGGSGGIITYDYRPGNVDGSSKGTRPILVKLSPDGDLIWFQRYTSPFGDTSARDLVALSNGDYCFLASASSITRVDHNGDTLFVRPSTFQLAYSLDKTMDGGFVLAGYNGYSTEPLQLPWGRIMKVDSLGVYEWHESAGISDVWNQFNSVREISDGGYICAGYEGTDGWLVRLEPETGIGPEPGSGEVSLFTPSPNPFSSSTLIRFSLAESSEVTLRVFDLSGRMIEQLSSSTWQAGEHQVTWSPLDIEPGCYLIVLDTSETRAVRRCVFLR